ncbi:MAG TPA: glycosyltransferase, partial [Anaerolineae bacterium]|nr:glycosyltransferase [Anaerolineae bacterium]
ILDSGRRCQFMIAGDGPCEGSLRRLCDQLGLAHEVTFVTRLKEYLSALSCLDVFVRPTLSDGLGFTLLQAMACGKAVVATDVGGAYSLIEDGVTGRLVAKDRSDKLTEAIVDLLDHPAMAQQFGRNARDFARDRFPMQAAVQQTLAVYRDAMAPRRRG